MKPEPKRGRWKSGQSGNPAGRRPGTGKVSRLRDGIAKHLPEIIARLVAGAEAGDVGASRLLLERVLPALKPTEQPVALTLPTEGGLTAQGESILAAVAHGHLAPGQAAQLLTGLGALARIKEIDELEARVKQLEERSRD